MALVRIIMVLAVVTAAGCGKSAEGNASPSGPTANSTPALPTSETLRAEACACTTKECADQVTEAMAMERQRVEEHLAAADACLVESGLGGPAALILRKMAEFRDQMCGCKDRACVESVEKGMMEWAMKNMEELQKIAKGATKAEEEQADKIEDEMDVCKTRAEGTGP